MMACLYMSSPLKVPWAVPSFMGNTLWCSVAGLEFSRRSSVGKHLNIPGLLKLQPKPHVLIHPVDAKARGIKNGDKVWVESPRGRVGFWAKVTDDVMTGQVEVNVGGGSPIHCRRVAGSKHELPDRTTNNPRSNFGLSGI